MRYIIVGIEYAGKTTMTNLLSQYYRRRGRIVHGDDHFSIPDSTLSADSQKLAVRFPNDVKERNQRMQIHYHVEILRNYENVFVVGWHIEEAIYSDFYGDEPDSHYYPDYKYQFQRKYEVLVLEARLPDIVLIEMTAADNTIRERMFSDPHEFQIIRDKDISDIKRRFTEECDNSLFKSRRIVLDTTGKSPRESLDELLLLTEPMATAGELAVRSLPVPDGEFDVVYENGVRKMVQRANRE